MYVLGGGQKRDMLNFWVDFVAFSTAYFFPGAAVFLLAYANAIMNYELWIFIEMCMRMWFFNCFAMADSSES